MTLQRMRNRHVLLVTDGVFEGEKFILTAEKITIGRAGHIMIEDDKLAPIQGTFIKENEKYSLIVSNQSHPIFVNDKTIVKERLFSLDEIKMGNTSLLYTSSESIIEEETHLNLQNEIDHFSNDKRRNHNMEDIKTEKLEPQKEEDVKKEFKTRRMGVELNKTTSETHEHSSILTTIKVTKGLLKGKSFSFNLMRIVIGRTIGDIIIDDPDISRKHCSIHVQSAQRIFLHDNASTNGTFLNNNKISYSLLKSGDEILLGNSKLVVFFKMN